MNKKKKIAIIVSIIAIVIVVIFGYFVYDAAKQNQILNDEMEKLVDADLLKDEIDMDIKAKGDYGVVEETIKTYLNDYAKLAKNVTKEMGDSKYTEVLTVTNIKKDSPDFKESEKTIASLKEIINQMNQIIDMTSKDTIMKAIKDKKLDSSYNDLYEEIMFDKGTMSELTAVKTQLSSANKSLEKMANTYTEAIKFLKDNKGKWQISGNQLYFDTTSLASEYNKIIAGL